MRPLSTRHVVIAVLVVLTLLVNALLSFLNIRRLAENERFVVRAFVVQSQIKQIGAGLSEVEAGTRAFVLTGDEETLEEAEQARRVLPDTVQVLRQDAAFFDEARLGLLETLVQRRMAIAEKSAMLRQSRGFEAARAYIATGVGERDGEMIRALLDEFSIRVQDRLESRVQESQSAAQDARRTTGIAFGLQLAFAALIAYLLLRTGAQTRQLERAYADLRRAEAMRDGLTSMLVHDLRTPLTSLLGPLRMLENGAVGPLDETQKELVVMSEHSGERLLSLVNELLDIAKMEAGEFKIVTHAVSLESVTHEALECVGALAAHDGAAIDVEGDFTHTRVWADTDLVVRVLTNLLANALKFTPRDGRIVLKVSEHDATHCRIEVRDSGEGIPPEYREHIFEKFGQVEARQRGRKFSTGLGLTFCKLAVEAHGGFIWVESEVGKGSTFAFTLPLAFENQNSGLPRSGANSTVPPTTTPLASRVPA